MKYSIVTVVIVAMTITGVPPVVAQERPDLAVAHSDSAIAERGVAAMAAVRIPLGAARGRHTVNHRVRVDLIAGPSFRLIDGGQLREVNVVNGEGIRLSFAPGHSTRLSLNGRALVTRYATLSAAGAEGARDGGSGGPTTVGWLAIAGGVALAAVGVAYLAYEDTLDCTEDGRNVCE